MGDYTYTGVPGKIKPLLTKIRTVGVPPKVTVQWLKTIGFTSSNDSSLVGVLRFVGLIDSSNVPTTKWTSFRGNAHKTILGDAIRTAYSDLFAVYSDANKRSQTELDHVFSTSSAGGKQVISKTIATFKALTEEAEFSGEGETDLKVPTGPLHAPVASSTNSGRAQSSQPNPQSLGPTLHIDIQIHISAEASANQIEQIFASMAKHVYGRSSAE